MNEGFIKKYHNQLINRLVDNKIFDMEINCTKIYQILYEQSERSKLYIFDMETNKLGVGQIIETIDKIGIGIGCIKSRY